MVDKGLHKMEKKSLLKAHQSYYQLFVEEARTYIELLRLVKHILPTKEIIKTHNFYKQPRPVSTLLKGLIRWLVHIHYNQKVITKTEYSTLILNKKESVVAA